MQKLLLGFAITIILVLATALVGPYFVDWANYRTEFEATANRLTGLDLRVDGPINLRILPTPTLTLQRIAFRRPGNAAPMRARALNIEFSLPALITGEIRAADLKLQGPELSLSMDSAGRLSWSAPSIGFNPDAVSIDALDIEDGRAVVTDAASGGRLVLEQFQFTGQVTSLRGPVKGRGSVILDGARYPYRLVVGRAGDDGAFRLRLNLDPTDDPRTAEFDASISFDHGVPHYDGTLQWARAVARGSAGAAPQPVPWRLGSRVHGDSSSAVLEQIELQFGADEQAVRLTGDAKLSFGARQELVATLSSSQIDLDQMAGLPDAEAHRPLVAVTALAEALTHVPHPPIPLRLGLSVDTATLGGAMLQRVSGEVTSDGNAWNIESFGVRAPGLTQMALSGRIGAGSGGLAFDGTAKIDSADPRGLVGWLTGRGNAQLATIGPLHVSSHVALDQDRVVLGELQAGLERMTVEGRLAYAWPAGDRPARLEATLRAPQLDVDRVQALLGTGLGGVPFVWPREGTLAIDIGRAVAGATEAKDINIKMRGDAAGLDIERLAIGDIGGAKLALTGHMVNHGNGAAAAARGAMTLDLDARNLDGVATLVERVSAPAAERIRRMAGRTVPTKLHGTLAIEDGAGANALAKLALAGSAGVFRLDLRGDADAHIASLADISKLSVGRIGLTGELNAGDGGALVELLGLERAAAVDKRSGRLTFAARGPWDGELAVEAALTTGGLDVSTNGSMRLHGVGDRPSAQLAVKLAADAPTGAGLLAASRGGALPPSSGTAQVALADDAVTVTALDGTFAGIPVKGRLGVMLSQPIAIDGDLAVGAVDLPTLIATAVGFPHASPGAVWPAEPFEQGLLGGMNGQIKIRADRLTFSPKLVARGAAGVLSLGPSRLALDVTDGSVAAGRITGGFTFERGADGLAAQGHLGLADVDVAALVPGDGKPPLTGRADLDIDLAGAGRSPVALVGSLNGSGNVALRDANLARLDPAAFEAVMRAVDQGLAPDAARIHDPMEAALSGGALVVSSARAMISINSGQLTLTDATMSAKGADLALAANVDLASYSLDARLNLSGPAPATGSRPQITVSLKGPIDSPTRQLDVAALATWLSLRAADQKTKRLEALQAARQLEIDRNESTGATSSSTPSTEPSSTGPSVTPPTTSTPLVQSPPRTRPRTSTVNQSPLPPPIDIRPQANTPRIEAGGERAPLRPPSLPNTGFGP